MVFMKKNYIITIIIFTAIIFFTFYYLENIEMAFKNVPPSVHSKYLEFKEEYDCGIECFAEIDICTDNSKNTSFFIVSGGYSGGLGKDIYFDMKGKELCEDSWSVDGCKGSGCANKECPLIGDCKEIACSTPCPIGTNGTCESIVCSS